MASLSVYKACEQRNIELGRTTQLPNGEISYKPNLFVCRIQEVVDMSEAVEMSEVDKRRHEQEDEVLRFLYIEN
jgi:hypothetical protein